jgi:hypothetical protein
MCLLFFTVAGVVHHHGLPGPARSSPALDGDGGHRDSLSAPCVACRSLHEHLSFAATPPDAAPAPRRPSQVVACEQVATGGPGREAGGSRAPPTSARIAV